MASSDGAVIRRAESRAHSLGVPFYRFTPVLDKEVALDEVDDEVLVDLLWTTTVRGCLEIMCPLVKKFFFLYKIRGTLVQTVELN